VSATGHQVVSFATVREIEISRAEVTGTSPRFETAEAKNTRSVPEFVILVLLISCPLDNPLLTLLNQNDEIYLFSCPLG
jgi:hypothetical protein